MMKVIKTELKEFEVVTFVKHNRDTIKYIRFKNGNWTSVSGYQVSEFQIEQLEKIYKRGK
jgi:hypothetical protein